MNADVGPTVSAGGPGSEDLGPLGELIPVIFDELRAMAHRQLARECDGVTLQTADVVHEAYLRLAKHHDVTRRGRPYFYAAAARAMRQVLVDAARRRQAQKRGGGVAVITSERAAGEVDAYGIELMELDQALTELARHHPRLGRTVECRFFGGMTVEDTAAALGISLTPAGSDIRDVRARSRPCRLLSIVPGAGRLPRSTFPLATLALNPQPGCPMSTPPLARRRLILAWLAQLIAAGILGIAGLAKLAANPDAVTLFTTLGAEPWGRLTLGSVELLTTALLLWPRTAARGGMLAVGLMLGAVATHLFKIGIVYTGDASLFTMAVIVLLAGATVTYLRRGSRNR